MGHLIEASFIPDLRSAGNLERMLTFEADAGDAIFINSSPKRSELFFEALCSLRKPDAGTVLINGVDLYALTPDQGAAFRRENIGAIPQGLQQRMASGFISLTSQQRRSSSFQIFQA